MLPTLVFILWAYGMYALISTLSGRKGNSFKAHSPWRRYGRLCLLASTGLGVGLVLVMANSFDQDNHNLKLAGFLGTVWAEGWPDKADRRVEEPPIKSPASGEQPVYALLHPGTSPEELAQEKTAAKPRPVPKPKMRKAPASQGKGVKTAAQKPKKEQVTAKNKAKSAKKKKPAPPAAAGKDQKSSAG